MKRIDWIAPAASAVLIAMFLAACAPGPAVNVVPTNPPPSVPTAPPAPSQEPTRSPQPTLVGDITLSEKDAGSTVRVKVGSTLVVSLEGNPSTGYTWELAPGENPLIEQVGQAEFEANSKLLGAPGKIILRFRATAPGQQALSLVYHRPFEKNTLPEKIFAVALIVTSEDGGSPQPTTLGQPALVVYPPAGMKGWLTYSDPTYGFSFQYPPEWKLEPARGTMIGHAVWLTPNTTSLARLQIAYKRAGDQAQIGRTGLGSGDVVQLGQVLFLGKAIDREVLVFAGKDMTVRYTCSGCMQRGDLIFGFDLDYLGNWADPTALPDDVLANADWIVASVQLSGASQ